MNPLNRRAFCLSSLSAAGALTLTSPTLRAQAQSLDLAKILVGFPAGAGVDVLARRIAERLAPSYAKQVIVENRPGAGGQLAVTATKTAPPDGSTILFTPLAMVGVYPHTYRSLPYNVETDLAPVTMATKIDVALAVGTAVPATVRSLPEFLEWAKANPSRANVGSPAMGSPLHFTIAELSRLSKVELQHIPYRGGGPAVTDVIGGQVPMLWVSIPAAAGFVKNGQLKALAVSTVKRSAAFPNVPTVQESGVADFEVDSWYAMFVPARTPRPVVERLNQALNTVLAEPEIREKLLQQGSEAVGGTPEVLGRTVTAEIAKWTKLAKDANIKAD